MDEVNDLMETISMKPSHKKSSSSIKKEIKENDSTYPSDEDLDQIKSKANFVKTESFDLA